MPITATAARIPTKTIAIKISTRVNPSSLRFVARPVVVLVVLPISFISPLRVMAPQMRGWLVSLQRPSTVVLI
jgi:hypothetical protein